MLNLHRSCLSNCTQAFVCCRANQNYKHHCWISFIGARLRSALSIPHRKHILKGGNYNESIFLINVNVGLVITMRFTLTRPILEFRLFGSVIPLGTALLDRLSDSVVSSHLAVGLCTPMCVPTSKSHTLGLGALRVLNRALNRRLGSSVWIIVLNHRHGNAIL